MAKEYHIYFNSRKIILTSEFQKHFISKDGLFVKFSSSDEITKLLVFFQSTSNVENLYIIGSNIDELFDVFSSNFEVIEAAGGLVKNQNNDVLLINRNGKWDLPKGKADNGESIEKTAMREVMEECGISNIKLEEPLNDTLHTYKLDEKNILKRTRWFIMTYTGSEQPVPQHDENITDARWVSLNELTEYLENTYSSIKEVFHFAGLT